MEVIDVAAGISFGIVFLYLGFNMAFRRKILSSLLASNKVFWSKMGHDADGKTATATTRIMIRIMGVPFMLAGIASFLKTALRLTLD